MIKHAVCSLALLLIACEQPPSTATPAAETRDSATSTVAVRAQTQTLALTPLSATASTLSLPAQAEDAVAQAFARKQSHVWLQGQGMVSKLLADDTRGSRHQRFLVSVSPQQTLLFAHNIDLAPRIADLAVGDQIRFKGEYIYNPKGGVMHWTHHDPQGRQHGWIQHHDHIYE